MSAMKTIDPYCLPEVRYANLSFELLARGIQNYQKHWQSVIVIVLGVAHAVIVFSDNN